MFLPIAGITFFVIDKVTTDPRDLGRIRSTEADSYHPAHFFMHTHREEVSKPTQESAAPAVLVLEYQNQAPACGGVRNLCNPLCTQQ